MQEPRKIEDDDEDENEDDWDQNPITENRTAKTFHLDKPGSPERSMTVTRRWM